MVREGGRGGGGKRGGVTEEHLPQRAHLLERTEQLQKSSDRLEEGIRIVRETEEIGMDVMDTLQRRLDIKNKILELVNESLLVVVL